MNNAKKQVICKKKSKKMAMAAYSENIFTAGIDERAPKKKQKHSEILDSIMLGITSPLILPIRSSKVSWVRPRSL